MIFTDLVSYTFHSLDDMNYVVVHSVAVYILGPGMLKCMQKINIGGHLNFFKGISTAYIKFSKQSLCVLSFKLHV